jgi:hypothetical protein
MSRRYNRAPVEQVRKPTFNVVKPFQGVTTLQFNAEMAKQLAEFLDGFDEEDLEDDLRAFCDTLDHYGSDPDGPLPEGICLSIDSSDDLDAPERERGLPRLYSISSPIGGVFSVSVNEAARQLLIEVISECEGQVDRTVWAFRLALEDPTGGPREPREARTFRPKRYDRDPGRFGDNRNSR